MYQGHAIVVPVWCSPDRSRARPCVARRCSRGRKGRLATVEITSSAKWVAALSRSSSRPSATVVGQISERPPLLSSWRRAPSGSVYPDTAKLSGKWMSSPIAALSRVAHVKRPAPLRSAAMRRKPAQRRHQWERQRTAGKQFADRSGLGWGLHFACVCESRCGGVNEHRRHGWRLSML